MAFWPTRAATMLRVLGAAAALAAWAAGAQAQLVAGSRLGNATRGAQAFAQCQRCHSLEPDKNLAGPTLHGLFGRRAGSVPGFAYSPTLRRSTVVWSADTLSEYLAAAKPPNRRAKMAVHAIADPDRLGDLLAYLQEASR